MTRPTGKRIERRRPLPVLGIQRPPVFTSGGWFDPFADEFVCFITRDIGATYRDHRPSQSMASFAQTHQALVDMYRGECLCLACHRSEVDLMAPELRSGFVVAICNHDDYDLHIATGCGICPVCCGQPDLETRLVAGMRATMTTMFESHKAHLLQ